jgi:hypothetical protein
LREERTEEDWEKSAQRRIGRRAHREGFERRTHRGFGRRAQREENLRNL